MKKILSALLCTLVLNFCIFTSTALSKNSDEITKIETQFYGYSYENDSDIKRVERLEQYAYGNSFDGAIEKRIAKLKKDLNISDTPQTYSAQNNSKNEYYYDYDDEEYITADTSAQYPIVDALEQKIFNKTNAKENIYNRVSKLEKQIFKTENKDKSLNERVDKLRSAIITDVAIAGYDDDGNVTITPTYSQMPTAMDNYGYYGRSSTPSYYTPDILSNNNIYNELSILERNVLQETHPTMSIPQRLSQLESKVFQRIYPDDDDETRLERIAAAAEAQKSTSHYSGSKFERNLATGMQIASFILMILAFVL